MKGVLKGGENVGPTHHLRFEMEMQDLNTYYKGTSFDTATSTSTLQEPRLSSEVFNAGYVETPCEYEFNT